MSLPLNLHLNNATHIEKRPSPDVVLSNRRQVAKMLSGPPGEHCSLAVFIASNSLGTEVTAAATICTALAVVILPPVS
jgi:hypothetical protein